jgi:DNA-binding PadR family transcriptional regulator
MGGVRRGDIRTALLAFLLEQPGHGYEAMQYLQAKTNGAWHPSAGSIYPALQQLEDEGLVRSGDEDGRRIYRLTPAGRREGKARIAERGLPWDHMTEAPPEIEQMRRAVTELQSAATEVLKLALGTDKVDQAVDIVRDARKRLYGLLAED